MMCQAQEFIEIVKLLGDEFELEIYGKGLLSYILETGASYTDIKEN